jgi:hypothetical protein
MQELPGPLVEVLKLLPALRDLAFAIYTGPMVAFSVLTLAQPKISGLSPETLTRTFRAWGPGFGISLGIAVFSALATHYDQRGAFTWGPNGGGDSWELAHWLLFLFVWISNIKLEVWTLEPLRQLDQKGEIKDQHRFFQASRSLAGHLALHASGAVIVLWGFLGR